MKRVVGLAVLGVLSLSGCGNFFSKQTGGGGGGGGTGNTTAGDVLYSMDSLNASVSGYVVSTAGALTTVTNSPYAVGIVPTSIATTPANTYLYVGGATGIVGYAIGTSGVLTALNSSQPLATDVIGPLSMQVDSTGAYLLVAAEDLSTTLPEIGIYSITATTGALTPLTGSPLAVKAGNGSTSTSPVNAPYQLYITPNNSYVYLTLGGGGTEILTFSAASGALTDTGTFLKLNAAGFGQYGVIANSTSNVLFIAETGVGVRAFTIATTAGLTEIAGSPFKSGNGPTGLALDSTGDYLYVTNKGDSTISGYSVAASGTLAALSSSPYSTGLLPLSLSLDQSKNFLAVANSGGTPNLGVYKFDATALGKLDLVTSVTSSKPLGSSLVVSTH